MVKEISGQLNFLEILAAMDFSAMKKPKRRKKVVRERKQPEKVEETPEGYLLRGERIESLAREKFQRMMENYSPSSLEEKIFSVAYNPNLYIKDLVQRVAKVIRDYLRVIEDFSAEDAYFDLKKLIDFDIELRKADPDSEGCIGAFHKLRRRIKKSPDQLVLTIREAGWGNLSIYGYRLMPVGDTGLMTDSSCYADIATTLSWLVLLTQYNRALEDPTLRGGA
jgi:hypothetical protein